MWCFEASGAPIVSPAVYWWYFIVTIATVGYGDFSPQTFGGRVDGALIIILGIGTFAAVTTKVIESSINFVERKKKGLLDMSYLTQHTVVLGFVHGQTLQFITELRGDKTENGERVLICANSINENPCPDLAEFVYGDPTDRQIEEKIALAKADRILACGQNDDETLAYGIAAINANKDAHIVAVFDDANKAGLMKRVSPKVECVTSLSMQLAVQALQDRGSVGIFEALASNLDQGATQYRLEIPAHVPVGATFGDLVHWLKGLYEALPTAIAAHVGQGEFKTMINPPSSKPIMAGMMVFYIANERLDPDKLSWQTLLA